MGGAISPEWTIVAHLRDMRCLRGALSGHGALAKLVVIDCFRHHPLVTGIIVAVLVLMWIGGKAVQRHEARVAVGEIPPRASDLLKAERAARKAERQ